MKPKQLISIRGYLIPDASMLVTHPLWTPLWTQSAMLAEAEALRRGITRIARWRFVLATGSVDGIVRVQLVSTSGVPFFEAHAPGHEHSGDPSLTAHDDGTTRRGARPLVLPELSAGPLPRDWQEGDEVTEINPQNPEAIIIERIECITPGDIHQPGAEKTYWLEALYLAKIFANNRTVKSLSRFVRATDKHHAQAKAYAKRYAGSDEEQAGDAPAQTGGGEKSTTRAARKARGKSASSQSSADAIRETQNGSALEHASQSGPSHTATSVPSDLSSSSTTAASESRSPKPKKRRIPRDQVS